MYSETILIQYECINVAAPDVSYKVHIGLYIHYWI